MALNETCLTGGACRESGSTPLLWPSLCSVRLTTFLSWFRRRLLVCSEVACFATMRSFFAVHMQNVAEILRDAPSPALVLLDEGGGGTDLSEGGALAGGRAW